MTPWKILLVGALVFHYAGNSHASDDTRIQQLEERLATMQEAMAAMQTELQSLRQEQQARVEEQQERTRRQSVLAEEIDKLRTSLTVPEIRPLSLDDGVYGLGPAASKVYGVEQGLSIGGYGEAYYRKDVGDKSLSDRDTSDFLRFSLYVGYKFTDRIIFNSELEFEHASTSTGGSVSVEFAYLDFMMWKWANFRAGMLLAPLGIVNELHEPIAFNGVERPEVERRIIPSTWRENGIGLFGQLADGLEYRMYAISSLKASGFKDNGLRSSRQKGGETLAEDIAFVGRLDYSPLDGIQLGVSIYTGNSGQGEVFTSQLTGEEVKLPESNLTIWEVHGIYRYRGLEARGLFAMSHLGDARELSGILGRNLANTMYGWYAEVAYDVLPLLRPGSSQSLSPFVRFSYVDLQHKMPAGMSANLSRETRIWTPGISYNPHPNVVLKVDYRNFDTVKARRANEVNFGLGFVF